MGDTATALDRIDREHFDLLLVDLVMPTGQPDGLAFVTTAQARAPGVPAIFITGYYGFVARSGPLPGDVIYKPVDLELLTSEIRQRLHA